MASLQRKESDRVESQEILECLAFRRRHPRLRVRSGARCASSATGWPNICLAKDVLLALGANGAAAMAITVTQVSASTAALAWMAIEWRKYGKPSVLGMATGAIAGLAAITPALVTGGGTGRYRTASIRRGPGSS